MKEIEIKSIAVLIACYNRKQKTIAFLDSLVSQSVVQKSPVDIYLLDDGSTDGTSDAVKEKYPGINILRGTGNLFWAGSMRILWQYALSVKTYDVFCLFNDDVILFDYAFEKLISFYQDFDKNGTILTGSTLDQKINKISYGGYNLYRMKHLGHRYVIPDDTRLLPCSFANANILLVDAATVKKIGIFPDSYTHGLADYDYTLTAGRSGIKVLVAPGYYGYCEDDHGANWLSHGKPLKDRIKYLYSPKGLAYKEYLFYVKKNFPADYYTSFIKLWMKTFFPIFWDKFKRRGDD